MNRGAIRDLVRFFINEPAQGFYKDSDLDTLINVAYEKVNAKILALDEDFYTVSVTFPTIKDTARYVLPADQVHLVRLEHYNTTDPNDITKLDEMMFPRVEDQNEWPFDQTGKPRRYWITGQNLHLVPIPDAVYNLRMYYGKRQGNLSNDTDVPAVPADFHDMIALWAARLAKIKSEDDASDLMLTYKERENELIEAITNRRGQDVLHSEGMFEAMF